MTTSQGGRGRGGAPPPPGPTPAAAPLPPVRIRSSAALGRALRAARTRNGLTQAELAERARATRQAIVALEAGHETRALEVVFDTLAALGLELTVRPRGGGAA